jgi:hypothetical protein
MNHYKQNKIEAITYITENEMSFMQGNLIKYASRYPHSGKAVDDLRKLIDYAERLIEQYELKHLSR